MAKTPSATKTSNNVKPRLLIGRKDLCSQGIELKDR
jgi:hypothetical protein